MDAVVIGTVFTDIKGFAGDNYNPFGRNPGRVELFQGGVGRNVAENLANLGLSVDFVSSVEEGLLGNGVLSRLDELNIDTSHVKKAQENGMGIWLLINDSRGEQAGSLSQLPDASYIEATLEAEGEAIISQADHVILEADVSAAISEKTLALAKKYSKKVYSLPATMGVVLQMPQMLSECECFICNHIEAGQLFHCDTETMTPGELLETVKMGMKNHQLPIMVVTIGSRGAVYCDRRTGICGHIPAKQVDVVDCSGAGDAFFSGCVAALIRGIPLEQAVQCGTRLAAATIQSKNCNCETDVVQALQLL